MKSIQFVLILVVALFLSSFSGTNIKQFPDSKVKTLKGQTVNIYDYFQKKDLTIVSFWASWCSPCKRELDAIAEHYEEWQEKYNVQLIAVTIDNARSISKVKSIQAKKQWDYIILCDQNQRLQASLNFRTIPQTFVVNSSGQILKEHSGYINGDELELGKDLEKFHKAISGKK